MQQVLGLALSFALLASLASAESDAPAAAAPPPGFGYVDTCTAEKAANNTYTSALAAAKMVPNFGKLVAEARNCSTNDSSYDEDDNEFDCSGVEKNCPTLYSEGEERLRNLKETLRKEEKDLNKELDEKLDMQSELKKDAASLAKEYAEKENDLNSDIVTIEKEYKESVQEKDKASLEQIHEIQETLRKIADENRKIVLTANRAMADLAKAKLNARNGCREQARKDYQATLTQLDTELARRGGKISGGFEGIENAEKYRKFLISKIKNPEPSEQFTLCYSAGDAVENSLQQTNINGALSMNEFTSQIEENNKQRDQLSQQLEQQRQLANDQKLEGYKEHQKTIQAIQQKILTNRQNFERESRALAEKQRLLESQITKAQKDYREGQRAAKNAETRYTCLKNKDLLNSSGKDGKDLEKDAIASYQALDNLCGSSNSCPVCITFNEKNNRGAGSRPERPATRTAPAAGSNGVAR